MMVMKSCTDITKKASSTISQASISTAMVTKLAKKAVMPTSSPAFSSSGRAAAKPVDGHEARPHQIGGGQRWHPLALRPSPAKDGKTMSARLLKLPSRRAKKPT